ncbi:ribonucleotide-diphosphate reductase subunit beta [Vibrio phage VBP32]|uniref:ribonucleoside-diphosphate reductase n=2 Tax=Stoningtonvirus VBP47 TaxID=2846606 RepID=M4SM12_9CAUD|nr:ribonucleoside diphosphate reductase subunit beta [Vibrio phage VBP47]YP_007676585.1 ribonucleotide-diphosphate reductase subunit beta [Vibrio phage VBP32]AGH57058.1 ribonucleoside diphosphate reductase subunit beta [Vibrio phage VBP47]AGH57234.1 ribonucleotide-diphosphate reductase subunit beta [Vibrio phage VBP32]
MSRFNSDNGGYDNGYPLFLGDDQGLFDTIHINYPQLEDLYQQQLAQLWNEFEVDLTQDIMDMKSLPPGTVDLMVKTVSWQWLADSVAGRSISGTLAPFITNSELEGLVNLWSFFETIHARTYSHIVKQTFQNPTDAMKETYSNMQVLQRSEPIVQAFDRIEALPKDASEDEKRDAILLAFVALFALEAIAFMASFAVTFAIGERGQFQGIVQLVKLIARDEKLHTRMDYAILDILTKDPKWREAIERNQGDIQLILDTVVKNELSWTDYVFTEGRQVVGLSAPMLKDYVRYMAAPVYRSLGASIVFDVPKSNPLPYMDDYLDGSKVQAANQEIQNGSYNVGALIDDTADLDFDDLI